MRDMRELLSEYVPFWKNLSEIQREALADSSRLHTFSRGNVIHRCGDDCLGIIYIMSGIVRVVLTSEEGRELTLFRLRAGEVYVLSATCVIRGIDYDVRFEGENPGKMLIVSSHCFDALYKTNRDVRLFALETANRYFGRVIGAMQKSLFMGFDKRLALYLWEELKETGQSRLVTTHERIAKNIGSAREVVSRTLKRFSDQGIVELERGAVNVPDKEKLKRYFEI